jgi:FkbM family methyltransferase
MFTLFSVEHECAAAHCFESQTIRQYDVALAAETQKHSVVEIVPVDFLLLPRVFAYLNDAHAQLGQAELRALDAMLQSENSSRNVEGELEDLKSKCKRCISELAQLTRPLSSISVDLPSSMVDQVSSESDTKYPAIATSNQMFDSPPTSPFESWILGLSDKVLRQSELDYRKLHTVSASRFSSLMPSHIAEVRETLDKWFHNNPPARIVDATAHIGVDSLNFALHFRKQVPQVHIRSFEPNPETFACLQRNVSASNLAALISAEQGSCLDLLKVPSSLPAIATAEAAVEDRVDLVYIDAPWGGTDYKDSESLHLYLSDERHGEVDILDLTRYLISSRFTRTVVLKVPGNFCFGQVDRLGLKVTRQDILQPSRRVAFVLLRVE